MVRRFIQISCVAAGLVAFGDHAFSADESAPTAEQLTFFEHDIRPLLIKRCYECHSAEAKQAEGKLKLDSREAARRGGKSGAAIVAGDPEKSRLVRAVRYADPLLQMPPDEKLPQREIDLLIEWVRMGAPDPRDEKKADDKPTEKSKPIITDEARAWWSFRPLTDAAPPAVRDEVWPAGDLDRFVLAKLEQSGLRPAPAADKRTLLRRTTFDLIGLPPTPEEVDAFLADDSPEAFPRVVERLLASSQYGERWGRHWLDVVRYADTSGCNGDFPIAEAYRYRNYVIDAFNRDKPYDRFLREQIAGDLLPAATDDERFENLIATGYLALSRRFSSLGEEFHLTLDDTVDNLGKALLGLSVSCARCHDHKFDPIPQVDYYALYGIFQSTTYAFPGTEIYRHTQHFAPLVSSERYDRELREPYEKMAKLDADIFGTYSTMAETDTGDEKNKLRDKFQAMQKQRDELIKSLPEFPRACSACEGTPTKARIHIKGDPKNLGAEVDRGLLQILGGGPLPADASGSGRKELAGWLADPGNPLVPRVLVNRVWLGHFGRGIVGTPDDFGHRGEAPTHPELLDWLSRRFVESGWSLKALHRLILSSSTYQMACIENPQAFERDPENRLRWTFTRRRLAAEEIRDATLFVSGALDASRGGKHPFPPEWEWRYSQHKPFIDDYPSSRRTIYVMQQRFRQQPFLALFDGADTNTVTGLRKTSTVAPQALFTLNSEFAHEQGKRFAERLMRECDNDAARIDGAFRLALGRAPSAEERQEGLAYVAKVGRALGGGAERTEASGQRTEDSERSRVAWSSYVRVLLGSNEFLFLD